jgi:hypothetical protein
MYELKTKVNEAGVTDFLNTIRDEARRNDAFALLDIMQEATREEPKMWGASIVGFGSYHYKYATGHEGDMCKIGFSPRKQNFSIYMQCRAGEHQDMFEQLGKHKMGVGCLYIKKLSDVNEKILKKLIKKCI